MPELPEVETVTRGLTPAMRGHRFVRVEQRRPNLRFPLPERFVTRLEGRTVTGLRRRAKYILVDLNDGEVLVMHLGMSGRFTISATSGEDVEPGGFTLAASTAATHDHIVFTLSGGAVVTYNDARRFGFMDLIAADALDRHKLFRDIGVEPLSNALHAGLLAELAHGRSVDLKAFLMDQRQIAGLGNIYVCEALWRAGLKPTRAAATLAGRAAAEARAEALVVAIRGVLSEAIEAGGSSLRDYKQVSGELGYFQKAHAVYGREAEPCLRAGCTGVVRRQVQAGRSTFFCPACQR